MQIMNSWIPWKYEQKFIFGRKALPGESAAVAEDTEGHQEGCYNDKYNNNDIMDMAKILMFNIENLIGSRFGDTSVPKIIILLLRYIIKHF